MSHRSSISSRRWFPAVIVSFFLMLLAFPALAGRIQVRDSGGLFSAADNAVLHGEASNYPFDVRILSSADFDKKGEFDQYVRAQVNEPNVVVVGIDKVHRFTSVHFGTGLGVPSSQFRAIEQTGNSHFRDGNWRSGIEAILGATKGAVHTATGSSKAAPAATAPQTAGSGSTVFFVLVVVLVVGGLVAFVGSVLSRRARGDGLAGPGAYPGGAGAVPPGPFPQQGGPYPPGYGPGPYGPGGYGPGPGYGRGSGLGGSILSAGLGGLAGYQLGKMMNEGHHDQAENTAGVVHHEEERENFDAGGSTGGWDDGGDSSGGGDWGGGGDSGGGGDW